jgi:hypothetical protein
MIHPGLAALEKWSPSNTQPAIGHVWLRYRIQRSHITVGVVGGKTPIRKLLNWIGTNVSWPMAGKMITLRHGACCSMPAAMPGRMESRSMRAVRNPGKKAGSPRTSMLGWGALNTNPSKTGVQRALHCRCGREKILALGLCGICCTLKRQDDEYFGELREQVMERDGHCCRVCGASGRRKRSIVVHHRVPGKSLLHLIISLCPGCHAKVGRTKVVLLQMPPLLLELWREQHLHTTVLRPPYNLSEQNWLCSGGVWRCTTCNLNCDGDLFLEATR